VSQPVAYRSLMARLFLCYAVSFLFGDFVLIMGNALIAGIRGEELMSTSLFIVAGSGLFALLLQCYSAFRLRPVKAAAEKDSAPEERRQAFSRLLFFPYELFWGFGGISVFFSAAFHAYNGIYRGLGWEDLDGAYWRGILSSFLVELSLALTISVVIFSLLRRLFRGFLVQWPPVSGEEIGKSSMLGPLLLTYGSTFAIALLYLQELILNAEWRGDPLDSKISALFSLFYFAFGIGILSFSAFTLRDELRASIAGIRRLTGGERGSRGSIPVLSRDETGELAEAFNALQSKIHQEYEELERELQLALNVQRRLLPESAHSFGDWEIAGACLPHREVGGDLFDVVPLDDDRFAFLIGDVSGKGLPAALIMSAVLVLFRSEVRIGGDPGQVLTRLNRQLCGTIRENAMVTLGLGMANVHSPDVAYASAGHLSPLRFSGAAAPEIVPVSSLPIGIEKEVVYDTLALSLGPGDQMVLYTDGLLETDDGSDGFAALEFALAEREIGMSLLEHAERVTRRCGTTSGRKADDRTLLVLNRKATLKEERRWEVLPEPLAEKTVAREAGDWASDRLSLERALDLRSALAEAVMNAIEHGNGLSEGSPVIVQARKSADSVVLRVYDQGCGFARPPEQTVLAIEDKDRELRGFGLVLIDGLCSEWTTGREDARFYIEMTFYTEEER